MGNPAKITKFTPGNLETVRECVKEALSAPVLAGLGIHFKLGRITYSDQRFSITIEGIAEGGLDADQERYEIALNFNDGTLPPRNWEFTVRGRRYRVHGMTKGHKILAHGIEDGGRYSWKVDAIKSLFSKEKAAS